MEILYRPIYLDQKYEQIGLETVNTYENNRLLTSRPQNETSDWFPTGTEKWARQRIIGYQIGARAKIEMGIKGRTNTTYSDAIVVKQVMEKEWANWVRTR